MAGPKKNSARGSIKSTKRAGVPAIARPYGRPDQHATAIAETVDDVWHRAYGHDDLDVPVSVVAVLAMLAPPPPKRDDIARRVIALDVEEFADVMRTQWAIYLNARPDLANRVWPLMRLWHGEQAAHGTALHAAKRVADAALTKGQLHLTGDSELRCATDLLGKVLTLLRGRKAAEAHAVFYTPAPVTEMMACSLGTPEEGDSVHEPTAGTGGMLRAAAQNMRSAGRDPATVTWAAVDLDELAIACLAVNVVLWGLGPRVLLGVGSVLTDDWMHRAEAERRETLDLAQQVRRGKRGRRGGFGLTHRGTPGGEHAHPLTAEALRGPLLPRPLPRSGPPRPPSVVRSCRSRLGRAGFAPSYWFRGLIIWPSPVGVRARPSTRGLDSPGGRGGSGVALSRRCH
ncbi:N-6 DNA methylase [Streptomonospora arabica]|uniref:N-6 DNA methylase n=1 Tax=Streptomonospora arabica TaxID=412417 RepID=A0ABV9SK78_9ACTN